MKFADDVEALSDGIGALAGELTQDILATKRRVPPDSAVFELCTRLQVGMLVLNTDCGTLKATVRAAKNTGVFALRPPGERAEDHQMAAANDRTLFED